MIPSKLYSSTNSKKYVKLFKVLYYDCQLFKKVPFWHPKFEPSAAGLVLFCPGSKSAGHVQRTSCDRFAVLKKSVLQGLDSSYPFRRMWLWCLFLDEKINISILWKSTCNHSRQIFTSQKRNTCIGHMHGKGRFHHPFLAQWVDTLGRHGISGTERVWVGWVGRHRWPRFLSRYFLFYPSPSHFCQVSLWSKSRYELSSPFRKNGDMFWQKILAARISFQRFYYLPSWALDTGSLSWKTDWGSHLVYMHTKLLIFVHANMFLCTSVYTCSWNPCSLRHCYPATQSSRSDPSGEEDGRLDDAFRAECR